MVTFTRFLLLSLHLLSLVYADEDSTSEALEWLEAERSVLVHLPTPDLFFCTYILNLLTHLLFAFIFNFTLTPDNRTLLLNDEPILPRAYPHIPTPLRAYQTIETTSDFARRSRTNVTGDLALDLDYYMDAPDTKSGSTSIYNTNYNPRLQIDILRASTPTYPAYSTPLSSDSQNQIWVWLEDLSAHPPGTPYHSIALRVKRVKVDRRWPDTDSKGTKTYRSLTSLKRCYIWSWLCADIEEYPYYQYIYRENFDQYGKKGSMRHFLTSIWGALVKVMGLGPAIVLLVISGIIMLLPVVYGVFISVKGVVGMYQRRTQEVDEWVADEEVEGLLRYDTYLEDSREIREEEVSEEEGGKMTSVEEPPPPYSPMKTEGSSTL
ncbi:hypothetical protein VF21_10570 [Pseudogymnoascus sp. 05NY08]|nr:hypothetical protein VF21_10570 [Pseudogymnoascus sp. 05NY08]